ncbi:MAG: hypothetical protein ACE10G_12055, partial [Gemmatimonadales bacterium]
MAKFQDEWLAGTIRQLLGEEKLEELRASKEAASSLWETAVLCHMATDSDILSALATRFRVKIADLSQMEDAAKALVTEAQARKYQILPVRGTDSYLEIATANPFDLDCEKTLAFATGREVRLLLTSPAVIAERLDELYRPDNVMQRILEGMGDSEAQITMLDEKEEQEELVISEAEASQRPVVRMVDLILSEGIL